MDLPEMCSENKAQPEIIGKYEYARLMAARVTALARNAPPMVPSPPDEHVDALLRTAELEFEQGVLPLSIVRRLPSNDTQIVNAQFLRRVPLFFQTYDNQRSS
jgi:DNA-directed RNA polymerase subunit K/omega